MRVCIIVLLSGVLSACANEITGPSLDAVRISGRVLEFTTRAPLASAAIEFRDSGGAAVTTATTDGNGQYQATLPRGGEYLLAVNGAASGFTYAGRSGALGDLLVDRGTCVARYGTVTDTSGQPVPGAGVSLGGGQLAVSNATGWYSFELGCPERVFPGGTTFIHVTHGRYAPWQRVAGRGIIGVQRFDVALEKPADD